jgi:hypothetical protein
MEHNGQVYDMASHEQSDEAFFEHNEVSAQLGGIDGVVCISFPFAAENDILAACESLGLSTSPKLVLGSLQPITDIRVLNKAVLEAKSALSAFRVRHQFKRIHLFVKAPSVFAMALSHRLNGIGVIQLYDWVDVSYMPTAELR